jgi:hypothetical protein
VSKVLLALLGLLVPKDLPDQSVKLALLVNPGRLVLSMSVTSYALAATMTFPNPI